MCGFVKHRYIPPSDVGLPVCSDNHILEFTVTMDRVMKATGPCFPGRDSGVPEQMNTLGMSLHEPCICLCLM